MKKIKDFYSKRNKVSLVEIDSKQFIYKVYSTERAFFLEKDLYLKLRSNNNELNIPKLLSFKDNEKYLLIEYIEGCTLIEKLEELEEINDEKAQLAATKLILKVLDWIETFYNIEFIKDEKIMLKDINFRNFIVKDNEIYGIDFENLGSCQYKDKTGEIIAFYITYNPAFSIFKNNVIEKVIEFLVEKRGYNEEMVKVSINNELNIIKKRRGSI